MTIPHKYDAGPRSQMTWVTTEKGGTVWPTAGKTTSTCGHHATVAAAPSADTIGTTVSHTGPTGSIPASVPMAQIAATDHGHQLPAPATMATCAPTTSTIRPPTAGR